MKNSISYTIFGGNQIRDKNTEESMVGMKSEEASSVEQAENDAVSEAEQLPQLRLQIEELSSKNAELEDKVLRAVAESENIRRRLSKEIEDAAQYAISNFAHDMIEVEENFRRAMESISKDSLSNDALAQSIYQGVEMTLNMLVKNREKHGIRRLDPMGQEFDHNFHQAIGQVEAADQPSGTIVQVVQAGYIIKDRLLRAALVMVAK
ncbi:MAG: nucleotide exchange factor GrpE [Proteobacteria bacterium]|nr:nucleotide exchange factor GrpE [Pseudomonadota bacterium]